MDSLESRRIAGALARRTGSADTSAPAVADAVVSLWREIERVLSPIVGTSGVGALSARATHLAGRQHPWLVGPPQTGHQVFDLERLHARLAECPAPIAIEGSMMLLQTFHDLLISMVGAALTDRLLGPVWDLTASGESARDIQT